MRRINQDIIRHNKNVYKKNCIARYASQAEQQFTLSATAGMLSLWNPLKSRLSVMQKNIIEEYMNFLFANLAELPTDIEISALRAIKKPIVSEDEIIFFKENDSWITILEIRDILSHDCPQNRYHGNFNAFDHDYLNGREPITAEEKEAAETGVYKGIVYYFSSGFGSTVCKEPQGKFGLTGRNKIAPPKSSRFFLLSRLPTDKELTTSLRNSIVIINGLYKISCKYVLGINVIKSNHKLGFYYINDKGGVQIIYIDEMKVLENELVTLGLLPMLTEKSFEPVSLDEKLKKIDENRSIEDRVSDKFKTRIVEHADIGAPKISAQDVRIYIHELIDTRLKICLQQLAKTNTVLIDKNTLLISGLPEEIGLKIGRFFDRKTAATIAQTCKSAYYLACSARESYLQHNRISYVEQPEPYINLYSSGWQIIVGVNHTFFFNHKRNELYGCGKNEHEELGIIGYCCDELTKIPLRQDALPKQVVAGMYHSCILYEDGKLYTMGRNVDYELGNINIDEKYRIGYQFQVNLPNAVVPFNIIVGGFHTIIVTQDKQLFSFGKNDRGQLGFEGSSPYPTKVATHIALPKNKIPKDIVAGRSHTLVLCEDNSLYGFGQTSGGQLGPRCGKSFTPRLIETPQNILIDKIFARGDYSLILTRNSELYFSGKLIHDCPKTVAEFTKLVLPTAIKIKHVYTGDEHIIIQSTDDKLYAYGSNQFGQLGLGDKKNRKAFEEIKLPGNIVPHTVITGYDYTFVIDEQGKIYGFGHSANQLGIYGDECKLLPTRIKHLEEIIKIDRDDEKISVMRMK